MTTASTSFLNLALYIPRTQAEGPGWRAAVWVQGCSILCKGCCNPEMLPFVKNKHIAPSQLAEAIINTDNIEGVTFLGGEPFDQAASVAMVAKQVQESGLSVMTFSGYTYQKLITHVDSSYAQLLAHTDLLVSGPFEQARYTETIPWVGSDNQEFHFLTSRYSNLALSLPSARSQHRVEIRYNDNDKKLYINGFAFHGMNQALLNTLREAGISFDLKKDNL